MATTPTYGIDYPANTDLVTNGAAQMQLLAGDVDTALSNQTQGLSTGYRNYVTNPNFSWVNNSASADAPPGWAFYVDTFAGTAFTRFGIGPTTGLPDWVAGYWSIATSANAAGVARYVAAQQSIGDVKALAGQTVIVSFYAKAAIAAQKIGVNLTQFFGTGGTPSATINGTGQSVTLSTLWTRYSMTFTVPSVSGKSFGTAGDDATILRLWTSAGSNFATQAGSIGLQVSTIEMTGVQVELSYLTPLEIRTISRNYLQASVFGLWTAWTPQFKQGASGMATTVGYAGYTIIGRTCIAMCSITAGAAGTAASAIQVLSNTTLPAPKLLNTANGQFSLQVGATVRWYQARVQTGPFWDFWLDNTTAQQTAPTLAIGNIGQLQVTYEIA